MQTSKQPPLDLDRTEVSRLPAQHGSHSSILGGRWNVEMLVYENYRCFLIINLNHYFMIFKSTPNNIHIVEFGLLLLLLKEVGNARLGESD